MKLVALLAAAASGMAMTLQAVVNAALSRYVGLVAATFVVNAVGLAASGLGLLAAGSYRHLATMPGVPARWWLGGLLGVFIVFTMAFTVARAGAGVAVSVAVTAQLILALIFDHFGLLGSRCVPATWVRLLGAGLLIAGAWLTTYDGR